MNFINRCNSIFIKLIVWACSSMFFFFIFYLNTNLFYVLCSLVFFFFTFNINIIWFIVFCNLMFSFFTFGLSTIAWRHQVCKPSWNDSKTLVGRLDILIPNWVNQIIWFTIGSKYYYIANVMFWCFGGECNNTIRNCVHGNFIALQLDV